MNLKTFIIQQAVAGAIINAVLNGLFGWFSLPGDRTWPLLGVPSLSIDIVLMTFGIAFGTGLVLTPQMRKQIASGKVQPPALPMTWLEGYSRWPASGFRRGLNLGVLGVVVCALPVIGILVLADLEDVARGDLTAFKAIYGAIEGGVVTPLLAAATVSDAQRLRVRVA
jgi:hypothetical protein